MTILFHVSFGFILGIFLVAAVLYFAGFLTACYLFSKKKGGK